MRLGLCPNGQTLSIEPTCTHCPLHLFPFVSIAIKCTWVTVCVCVFNTSVEGHKCLSWEACTSVSPGL